jgi:alkylation response protein AidB-like acyl-CoA dehydrogenase
VTGVDNDYPMYALSEEHQAIREAVRAVCDAKVAPFAAEVDEEEIGRAHV